MRKLRIRGYLAAGLLVCVPLAVTVLFVNLLINLIGTSLFDIPDRVVTLVPGFPTAGLAHWLVTSLLGVTMAFTVLITTGFFAANLLGKRLLAAWESLLARIPLVSWVYSGVKKVAETLLSPKSQSFRKVLLVEYPRKGIWSLCFQTSSALGEVQARTGVEVCCVFVPTTPNPTSGFIILVPRDEVIELDMTVDEALRMIISLGVVVPEWRRRELVPVVEKQEVY